MRKELFYKPTLLLERLSQEFTKRSRLGRLRGTCAAWLTVDHIDSMELIDRASRAGARVYYDIGANVGSWTLLCRALVPSSVIVALEPMPEHIEKFQRNTAGLQDIVLLPVAAGSHDETRSFYPSTFSDASSFLLLNELGRSTWRIDNRSAIPMALRALDRMISEESLPHPDLIKLDVQGYELEVLKGATNALASARWVLSEVSFKPFYEKQVLFSGLAAYLSEHGYEVSAFGSSMRSCTELGQADVLFRKL